MKPPENIEKLIKNIDIDTNARMDKAVLDDVLKALENSKKPALSKVEGTKPATHQPNIWRIIMKSNITKFAAAAVIIVAVLIGLHWFGTAAPAYGITDVPEILRQARSIHFKGWRCAIVQRGLYDPNVVRPGQKETRALYEYWVDMETGKFRCTEPTMVIVEGDGIRVPVYTEIYDGEFIMRVNNEKETVSFRKLSPYQQLLKERKNFNNILDNMLVSIESLDAFERTGQEEIDSQIFDVWQAELSAPSWGDSRLRLKAWVSPSNGQLERIEVWQKEGDLDLYQFCEINHFEYGVAIPDNIFETEAPLGYSGGDSKEIAKAPRLFQNRNRIGGRDGKYITSYACFTLNDGSVILGWSCTTGWPNNDWESDSYQEALFQELTFGGELPKLPIEFYTVSPIGDDPGVRYFGRHLSYTQMGNIFHEWGLYVPEKELDKYYGKLAYNLHYRSNSDEFNASGASTLGETGDIKITNERDFDLFVLGAMAELSDDGKAPEHVTYENVLQLAKKIRDSLNK